MGLAKIKNNIDNLAKLHMVLVLLVSFDIFSDLLEK